MLVITDMPRRKPAKKMAARKPTMKKAATRKKR